MAFYKVLLGVSSKELGGLCETAGVVQADSADEAVKIYKETADKYLDGADTYIDDIKEYSEVFEITPNNGVIFSDMNEYRKDDNEDYNGTTMIEETRVAKPAFTIQK